MDFVFEFVEATHKSTGILVFVDRFRKMVHLAAIHESITAQGYARVFIYTVVCIYGFSL